MGKREILLGSLLATFALGGAVMTQVAAATFPNNELFIFYLGLAIACGSILGLLILFALTRSSKSKPNSVSKQSVISNNQSGGITAWSVRASVDE